MGDTILLLENIACLPLFGYVWYWISKNYSNGSVEQKEGREISE